MTERFPTPEPLIAEQPETEGDTFCLPPSEEELPEGTTRERDGRLQMRAVVYTGFTLREYYSHHMEERGISMGPGWDYRSRLIGPFTIDQARNSPHTLPDVPYYQRWWVDVHEGETLDEVKRRMFNTALEQRKLDVPFAPEYRPQ
jgi:hypothetical protein